VRYHLAELDWRHRAELRPADPTPGEAYSRIEPQHVVPERVTAVLAELEARPSFWYYAGGEAVYAVGWSPREHSLVRFYSCC
jgi:predicted nicotinamide N-methyase